MKKVLRILIVEDSEDDTLLVLHQVKKGGYDFEFERVDTAEKMWVALKEKTWDIILSDYVMPRFNGLEALAILKESDIDIPFIVISGTIGEEVAVEAMKAGAHDYIMKNNLQRLLPAVDRELRESINRTERRLLEQKQKQAEVDRLAHLRFLESMDKVNQTILGSNDLEQMMTDFLKTVLSIFDCDRAWLLYPCDPEAPSFHVHMEITKPEYPGAKILNVDVPMSPGEALNMKEALESDAPVTYTTGTERPIMTAKQFGVQSQMFVAVNPKLSKPWVFGMHQCSYPRIWTPEEKRLFQEIGRRLSDALTSLLMFRDLCKSEAENRAIVNAVPDLLFRVSKDGIIGDFRKPDNMELYAPPDQFLGKNIVDVLPLNVTQFAVEAIEKALNTNEVATFEYDLMMNDQYGYFEGRMVALSNDEVLTVVRDITKRKRAETEISRVNRALMMLSETNSALIRITDEEKLLNDVCHIVVEVSGYHMAWVGRAEHDEEKTLQPLAYAGIGAEYIKSVKVSWGDNELGHGPGGTSIRTGQPCIVRNIPYDPSFTPWREAAIQYGFNSIISLPLISEGQTYGAMGIYSVEIDAFDDKEVEILTELANDLAFGVSGIHTRIERLRAVELQAAIYRISEAAQTTAKLDELFGSIHAIIAELMPARNFYISLYDKATETICFPYFVDEFDSSPSSRKPGRGLTGYVLRTGNPLLTTPQLFEQLVKSGQIEPMGKLPVNWLGVPLKTQHGETIGVMAVQTYSENNRLNINHQNILEFVSAQVAMVIERKKSENELRKLSEAVEQSPASIVITDINGSIEYVNKTFEDITGYSILEAYHKTPRILQSGHTSKVEYKVLWDTILSGKTWHGEFLNKKKNGKLYWEDAFISPIKDKDGIIINFLAVKQDITEKKKIEQELIEAKEHAEESDRLKTAFLQNMSHEIRTPMNSIMGFASLLPEEESKELIANYARIIVRSSEHLVHIIDDIVLYSKLQTKTLSIFPNLFNAQNLLIDIKHSYDLPEFQVGVDLKIENGMEEPVWIRSDYEKLRQVFMNLISNAYKYTHQGIITIGFTKRKNELVFFVRDTGIGIPPNEYEKVFERFYRGSNVDKAVISGTGLGLSIVMELVELLGGNIWVESEIGKGSAFFFSIPLG